MAKKKKTEKQRTQKSARTVEKKSLFERLDERFGKRHHAVALFITLLSFVLALLMFDAKISTGLDDSTYIQQGYKYSKDFFNHFFTSQAPFYAMFLAIPIGLFGINIILLKFLSVLFFTASVYMLYRALRFKVGWFILFTSLFIYATNSEALKYASLTYTEAFYLFIQAGFIWLCIRLIDQLKNEDSIKDIILKNLLILISTSVVFYFMFLTRTVGIAAAAVMGAYYLFRKEYKLMVIVPAFFAASYLFFEFLKKTIWSNINQFSAQSKILLQKDAYDASQGNEDLSGFLTRFLDNTNIYFSQRFYEITGFREFPNEPNMGLAILTVVPLVIALIMSIRKKDKYIMFGSLFLLAICGFTFLALQKSWGQARYIMIVLPFIFMSIIYVLKEWFSKPNTKSFQLLAVGVIFIFVASNFVRSAKLAKENIPTAKANIFQGDKYAGYTPDWVNFLKLSEWCGKNLPDSALVASRKAPMSFLYADGKEFYPIWRTSPNPDPDSTLKAWQEAGVTHVIIGSLRVNPLVASGGIINTVHRILQPIQTKYPQKLELVRTEGTSEDARLARIKY